MDRHDEADGRILHLFIGNVPKGNTNVMQKCSAGRSLPTTIPVPENPYINYEHQVGATYPCILHIPAKV
jgi:hypothetical protein